jgi:hypothetical protein
LRKYYLLISFFITAYNCTAQETTPKRNRLTETVTEHFNVLKSNKNIKEGLYQALYLNKTAIATGKYADNQKTGLWNFFDTKGTLVQRFNYNSKRVLYEEPVDSLSLHYVQYLFDRKFKDSDRITKPIRVGGRCYGYLPYLSFFHLSADYYLWGNNYYGVLELLISPSPDIFSEEDKQFIPATLNGEPILSRIFVICRVTHDGGLDIL